MRKLNKQDLIFIGKIVLYITITFIAYLFITQYFILDNCRPTIGGLSAGYVCFGDLLYFFDKVSIYLYTLFLWITIIPFIRRRYQFPNILYIIGLLVLMGYILWIYRISPVGFPNGLPSIGK